MPLLYSARFQKVTYRYAWVLSQLLAAIVIMLEHGKGTYTGTRAYTWSSNEARLFAVRFVDTSDADDGGVTLAQSGWSGGSEREKESDADGEYLHAD